MKATSQDDQGGLVWMKSYHLLDDKFVVPIKRGSGAKELRKGAAPRRAMLIMTYQAKRALSINKEKGSDQREVEGIDDQM
ncbi:hypothetical protein HPP92_010294 [Vanilla planifolia]|uniref:Uncharacterized protein n=1 Tax=Vanilla planifolia TaxID=51239 RepID=A0A835QTM9_VANPL|nr:hypothetical protein HPP92_010294 [Vanilla planifolia]